jgi:hypothetical protein
VISKVYDHSNNTGRCMSSKIFCTVALNGGGGQNTPARILKVSRTRLLIDESIEDHRRCGEVLLIGPENICPTSVKSTLARSCSRANDIAV